MKTVDFSETNAASDLKVSRSSHLIKYILSVNEKLPVSKFRYFGKYMIQLDGAFAFI